MHEFLSKSHTTLRAEWNPITPQGNSKMAARSVVVRERNERGFRNFLQNLKAIFRVFLAPENGNLAADALVKARHHLLDARGTLSLLIVELERGGPNPTGLPTSTLQAPLQNLNRFVVQMIKMLPAEIESGGQAENFDHGCAYSTSVTAMQCGPGAGFSKLPRPVKLFCFPFQMGVSKLLKIIQ